MTGRGEYHSVNRVPRTQKEIDATVGELLDGRPPLPRTWYQACECCFVETVRVIALVAVYTAFYIVPFAVYADRERQIPEAIRHEESFSVSTMRSHSMYAWDNLAADGDRHRSVLQSQDYYAFTFFVQMINLLCWFPWVLMRYFRDGRDAILGVFAVSVVATSFYHLMEQEVGVQGLMQLESTAFSLALGFVVRDSSPPRFSGRMAFTLFCLWDFLNQKLGFMIYSCGGWTLHVALALFLWAYTNYTHQLCPGSLIINYLACVALIRFFNFWSDHEARTEEIERVQISTRKQERATFLMLQQFYHKMSTTSEERQRRGMTQGLQNVPASMMRTVAGHQEDHDDAEVGFHETGQNLSVFVGTTTEEVEQQFVGDGPFSGGRYCERDEDDSEVFSSSHSAPPDLTQEQREQLMEWGPTPTRPTSKHSGDVPPSSRSARRRRHRPVTEAARPPSVAAPDTPATSDPTPEAALQLPESEDAQQDNDETRLLTDVVVDQD